MRGLILERWRRTVVARSNRKVLLQTIISVEKWIKEDWGEADQEWEHSESAVLEKREEFIDLFCLKTKVWISHIHTFMIVDWHVLWRDSKFLNDFLFCPCSCCYAILRNRIFGSLILLAGYIHIIYLGPWIVFMWLHKFGGEGAVGCIIEDSWPVNAAIICCRMESCSAI